MTIASIVWPEDARDAVCQLLRFQLLVLQKLKINLPKEPNDPIGLAEQWIEGVIADAVLDEAVISWWTLLDTPAAITDLRSRFALEARFALCLISVRDSHAPDLGEYLSWFLEVLGFYGADTQEASALMYQSFTFNPQSY